MSKLYNADAACLRYVVPFKFSIEFNKAVEKVEKQEYVKPGKMAKKLWERKISTSKENESDLYSYVKNEFLFDDDNNNLPETKSGFEWLYLGSTESSNSDRNKRKKLSYFYGGIDKNKKNKGEQWDLPDDPWNIDVINVGLILFRNGLGFIWYELQVNGIKNSDQLVDFQNNIKELNRSGPSRIWEKIYVEPECGIELGNKEYLVPFHFGNWINGLLAFFDDKGVEGIKYFAERKNSYSSFVKINMKKLVNLKNSIINAQQTDESNKETKNLCKIINMTAPDKAILFSYVMLEKCKEQDEDLLDDRYTLTYWIANGYKSSYHFSDELKKEIKRPFDNVMWYATQEGVAYLAWPEQDNESVFKSGIASKIRTDYFVLFIKNLYQSYTLLIYAERIQNEISAVNGESLEKQLDQKITELFGEINLFLTKSMATSVSHIHHQNEFYDYVKKQLRIREDVESVTSGLKALDVLQREQRKRDDNKRNQELLKVEKERERKAQREKGIIEAREKKRDEKLQAIMGLFTLLGIFSAFTDFSAFVDSYFRNGGLFKDIGMVKEIIVSIFLLTIVVVSVMAIVFTVMAIINVFKKDVNNISEKNKKNN